ncbi:hypothetical protein [Lederbergia citri]|uniref:Uncharacterized protein n=1 Tax=Lederbergia citri TaxID=2833580 RepID=A0A942YHN2_9BACI|nr:hypothetical protein [Lederbergia citri]MBS4196757.1 hypothetical protein [Lederbergia citri]
MTLFFLVGIFIIVIILLNKQAFLQLVSENTFLVKKLSESKWFHNKWLSGLFLFSLNAILFFFAVGTLYLTSLLLIPYIHLVFMILATISSIYLWMVIRSADKKQRKDQMIMGGIGSSFYLFLFLGFLYMAITLESSTPENDTFMAFIGLVLAMFVSFVAMTVCFIITGLINKKSLS